MWDIIYNNFWMLCSVNVNKNNSFFFKLKLLKMLTRNIHEKEIEDFSFDIHTLFLFFIIRE